MGLRLTRPARRNRGKRQAYEQAVADMLERTDTDSARWHVVPAESKRYARTRCMELVIEAIEDGSARREFALPDPIEPDTH